MPSSMKETLGAFKMPSALY